MAIDARRRRPRIATTFGGLSGPAIKPIALRMVYQVHRALPDVPICGIGGIATGEDVVEFLLAGATTVQVGTQSFAEPHAAHRIRDELVAFMREEKVSDVRELIGALAWRGRWADAARTGRRRAEPPDPCYGVRADGAFGALDDPRRGVPPLRRRQSRRSLHPCYGATTRRRRLWRLE